MKRTILEKLRSTKLWCALLAMVLGAAMALGADGETLKTVAGAVTALLAAAAYIVTEGKVDAASAQGMGQALAALLALFGGEEDGDEG